MESALIGVGIVALTLMFWRAVGGASIRPSRKEGNTLPREVVLKPQEILTAGELRLYNLIRMATQDEYLVLCKVAFRSILSVEAEGTARLQALRRLALNHLDFVLVHPGSRMAEHVVLVDEGDSEECGEYMRRQEIQEMVIAAGISLTVLTSQQDYTVQQLEQLLGMSDLE